MNESARPFLGFVKYTALVAVICVGLWGCSKPSPASSQERVRSLEGRCVQLEQDYRTVAQARDRARKELAEAQQQLVVQRDMQERINDLQVKLRAALGEGDNLRKLVNARTQERDALRQDMAMRMNERDALMTRCDKLRKGIQSLLSQDEPAMGLDSE